MLNIINCYYILRPTPSHVRLRERNLMLPNHAGSMASGHVLLHIVACTPFLMSSLTPLCWACCRRMVLCHVETTGETIVPIRESFHWIGNRRYTLSLVEPTVWGNLIGTSE